LSPREKQKPWKDYLDRAEVERVASVLGAVYSRFDQSGYVAAVLKEELLKAELKDRIRILTRSLKPFLPAEYPKAIKLLMKVAPKLKGFGNWVLTDYVELYGQEHFKESVAAMKELTKHGTAEFCIRPFMINQTDRLMPILHEWALDSNEHVRRLAAEGSRPRGVWVAHIDQFKDDPTPVLELMEKLKADESLYVRKAVANNLNDISKEHPDLVIQTALKWKRDGVSETDWSIRHACRTLIKQSDPRVFEVLGFTKNPRLKVGELKLTPRHIKLNGSTVLTLDVRSNAASRLAIDYKVYYVTKSGRLSPKVFKWAEKSIAKGDTITLTKKHAFIDHSTRVHNPGQHLIEVTINGRVKATAAVTLTR